MKRDPSTHASLSDTRYRFRLRDAPVGAQMLLTAFGALVLVPLLTGLDPNVALFTAGAGTLVFQAVTGGRVPIFLASSFAFVPAMLLGVTRWGIPATLSGLAAAGVLYLVLALAVLRGGTKLLERIFPPVVTGPIIMVIGLILAPVAVNMASGRSGDGATQIVPLESALPLAAIALAVTALAALLGRGWARVVPILLGIGSGCLVAWPLGLLQLGAVGEAAWFALPEFVLPRWSWPAVLAIVPVALAPAIEHFGDILGIGAVTGEDYTARPGLHRTLAGDGLATILAASVGGPPNTTYSEVTGAVALTRVFNPAVMTWAALVAIALSCCAKLGLLLQAIPVPVMGGVLILLFGAIAAVGLALIVRAGVEVQRARNLMIVGVTLVAGTGGLAIGGQLVRLEGVGLAAVVAVGLNLVLPRRPSY